MKTFLIQASHGGFFEGKYWTNLEDGKFYDHGDFIAYEGVTNRAIARKLQIKMINAGIQFEQLWHEYKDFPKLTDISAKVNSYKTPGKDFFYLPIHSNAGKGFGFEFFVSANASKTSIRAAEIISEQFKKDFEGVFPIRQEVKERLYKVRSYHELKATFCPAVLPELLFFDELKQAEYLKSEEGQEKIASTLFEAVKIINDMP
jgi:N-acetylmuramoyl-L-alanine amidase